MDCPYCQNAEIIPRTSGTEMTIPDIAERVRGNLTDGYCITGGEPTIHKDLPDLLKVLRDDGTGHINLNTQGSVPNVLERCLPYLDSIWFDVKTTPVRYLQITRTKHNLWSSVERSIKLILESNVAFWPRTTYVGRLMNPDEIVGIAHVLENLGFEGEYLVQNYVQSSGIRESEIADFEEPSREEIEQVMDEIPPKISLRLEWR